MLKKKDAKSSKFRPMPKTKHVVTSTPTKASVTGKLFFVFPCFPCFVLVFDASRYCKTVNMYVHSCILRRKPPSNGNEIKRERQTAEMIMICYKTIGTNFAKVCQKKSYAQ